MAKRKLKREALPAPQPFPPPQLSQRVKYSWMFQPQPSSQLIAAKCNLSRHHVEPKKLPAEPSQPVELREIINRCLTPRRLGLVCFAAIAKWVPEAVLYMSLLTKTPQISWVWPVIFESDIIKRKTACYSKLWLSHSDGPPPRLLMMVPTPTCTPGKHSASYQKNACVEF